MKWVLALVCVASLALMPGCAYLQSPGADDDVALGVEYICTSASFSIRLATVLFDELSDEQRRTIDRAIDVISPVCSAEERPTLDSTARAALAAALLQITGATTGGDP